MRSSSLEPLLRFHLRLFQCFGIQSFPQTSRTSHRLWTAWTFVMLAGFSALTLHTYVSDDDYLYRGDRFGYFNNIVKVAVSQLALTIAFVETIVRRREVLDFWVQYAMCKRTEEGQGQGEEQGHGPFTWRQQCSTYFRFLGYFYAIFAAEAFLQTLFFGITGNEVSHHLNLFWSMFSPYIAMVRLRHMQYILYMECIRLQLQQLERELRLLADYTNFAERIVAFEGFEEFIRRKLLHLQRDYDRIYDMFWNYHQAFSFSIPAVLLMQYIRILVDTYFIFYYQYRDVNGLVKDLGKRSIGCGELIKETVAIGGFFLSRFQAWFQSSASAMSIPTSCLVRWHCHVFRLFGFLPISFRRVNRTTRVVERLWALWSLVIFVIFKTMTIVSFVHTETFLYSADGFGLFVDSIKLVAFSVTLYITLCETMLQRSQLKRFWILYATLANYRGVPEWSLGQQIREYRLFLALFYASIICNGICVVYFFFNIPPSGTLAIKYWSIVMPFIYVLSFRNLSYVFYMELVRKELEHLAQELGLLVIYTEFSRERQAFRYFDEFIVKAMVEKQAIYMRIYAMVEYFKGSSSYSMVSSYLQSYIRIVVDFYWIVWAISKRILLLPALFEIPMMLMVAMNCMNAVKYITLQLHSIKHSPDNVRLSTQIQNFSLQILHQQIRIDAFGITVMDGYMLTKVIGSITTYMIFFIQFIPKFQKL